MKYKLPIRVIVIKNSTLGQIKWEQLVFLGNPEYERRSGAHRFCDGRLRPAGRAAFRIDNPQTCGAILDEALAVDGPVLIEAVVDPYEPPFPGKKEFEQAAHFAKALLRGEPQGGRIAFTAARDMIRELV